MTLVYLLLFIGVATLGGWIGLRRISFLLAVTLSGTVAFLVYRAYNVPLTRALMLFGFEFESSFLLSLAIVVLIPFFGSAYLLTNCIGRLGLTESTPSYLDDEEQLHPLSDRIFGAGISVLVLMVCLSLYAWSLEK